MSNETITALFKAKGIRSSEAKLRIIQIFMDTSSLLSANNLHKILSQESAIDLATIYRNLNQFKECGILREVLANTGESHFELALNGRAVHPHFWCVRCKKPQCLAPLSLEETLGFASFAGKNRLHSITISMEGVCEECQNK
ncbi:MAG: Fur family transcriptional regulator [Wolinella sp.]